MEMEQQSSDQVLPQAIIFDVDGTLFKTESIIVRAYDRMITQLKAEGLYTGAKPPVERLFASLGMLLEDIWRRVLPGVSESVHRRADELLLANQLELLDQDRGKLYPGVKATLEQLKANGFQLFVASNGLELYVDAVLRHTGIAALFDGVYSAGQYQTASKNDLVKLIVEQHSLASGWMVGDRSSDVEAGKTNQLRVIGCDYAGFGNRGELAGADERISSFDQLLKLTASL